nr:hypothetical protein [Candidatus Gromoviella agglomerans]
MLAGRQMTTIQTAMSVASADTSSWVIISLPAAVYTYGMSQSLIPIGLIIGSYISWKYVAAKLRQRTIETDSMTIPEYLSKCCVNGKNSSIIKTLSSIIILIFLVIYIASGLKSGAILVQCFTGIKYHNALKIFTIFIILYSSIGGMKAMGKLDIIQVSLIMLTLISIPLYTRRSTNIINEIHQWIYSKNDYSYISIISSLCWGLGYLGEPHLLLKFMASKSSENIEKARKFCLSWMIIAFSCAVTIGCIGKTMWTVEDPEQLFFHAVFNSFGTHMIGIIFSGVIAAILSTICAQTLACSSILMSKISYYIKLNSFGLSFIPIFITSGLSFIVSFNPENKIMDLVAYSWAGLGSSFGAVIVYSIYSKRCYFYEIFLGIVMGFFGVILCGFLKWSQIVDQDLYEMIPGFVLSIIGILFGRFIHKNSNKSLSCS